MSPAAPVQRLKLRRPAAPEAVEGAERIAAPLLDAPHGSTTVLTAAPGYGRTTAAALAGARTRTAWLSCDRFDRDPARLQAHLLAATTSGPGASAVLEGVPELGGLRGLDVLLDTWSSLPPTTLVLDDVHEALSPQTAEQLAYLAAHLPSALRLLLTSAVEVRGDLPESIGVHHLDEDHLALSDDEATAVLDRLGISSRGAACGQLLRVADGWPAALAAAGRACGDAASAAAGLRGTLGDHLLTPWWSRLPDRWRAALLGTVEAPVLSPAVHDLLLEGSDGADVVAALVEAHAYLRPVMPAPGMVAHRRHPVLTGFLHHRAGAQGPGPQRHRAAAAWAADHGAADLEVRHLAAAGDVEAALAAVLVREEQMLHEGRSAEVLSWYDLLPPEALVGRAEGAVRRAWGALLAGDVDEAAALARRLESLVATSDGGAPAPPAMVELQAEAAVLSARLAACRADPATMLAQARRAQALFGGAWSRPVHEAVGILVVRALTWWGRSEEAAAELAAAQRRPALSHLTHAVHLPLAAAGVALLRGEVRRASVDASRALAAQAPASGGRPPLGTAEAHLALGLAHVDLAEFADASAHLGTALEVAGAYGEAGVEALARLGQARLAAAHGDPRRGIDLLALAADVLRRATHDSALLTAVALAEAGLRLQIGDAARAARCLSGLPPSAPAALLGARLAQLRRPGSGLARIMGIDADSPRSEVERAVLLSAAQFPRSSAAAGATLVEAALLAEDHGLRLALVGLPRAQLEAALGTAAREGCDPLAALARIALAAAPRGPRGDEPDPVGLPLSAGERQLLALLPSRATNAEIATALSVSVNTVKTRLRRLYAKVGARSRDDAIRAARAQGLLG